MIIRLIKWGKQKKRSKARRVGSRQPKPLINGFSSPNVFIYVSLIILFLISKEFFSYDEEFIIILCLFIVFFVFIEGLNKQVSIYFDTSIEGVLNYYLERFLFTKWGLIKMKKVALSVLFNQLEIFFINYFLMLKYFSIYAYNYYLRKVYISLTFKELLLLKYMLETILQRKNYLDFI